MMPSEALRCQCVFEDGKQTRMAEIDKFWAIIAIRDKLEAENVRLREENAELQEGLKEAAKHIKELVLEASRLQSVMDKLPAKIARIAVTVVEDTLGSYGVPRERGSFLGQVVRCAEQTIEAAAREAGEVSDENR